MTIVAIILGKLALLATRITNLGSGTTFPGLLAEKIDRNVIKKLSSKLKDGVIVVTGTNGKTTTAKILSEILSEEGYVVLNNQSGSNLTRGIASALINASNIFGFSLSADIGVFEIDEATMTEAMTKLRPKVTVVTNLFRDQLDRYGELDKTATIIGKSLRGFSQMTTILNADDPLVSSLASYAGGKVVYFGVNEPELQTSSKAAMDSKDCLVCGHELDYETRYFGHLGKWKCSNCGNQRPDLEYLAENIKIAPNLSKFDLKLKKEDLKIEMPLSGLYNIYNALAAASVAKEVCCAGPAVTHALRNFAAAFGRMETLDVNDRKMMLLLVKNPTGANQSLASILSDEKEKNILLALNDNFADGTDVSWIWDIDFESFDLEPHQFFVTGIRANDMALRLKYAGLQPENIKIYDVITEAVTGIASATEKGEFFYVLPTYTAMMDIRGNLAEGGDNFSKLGKVTKRGL